MPLRVKQHIYAIDMFDSYYITIFSKIITSVANNTKNIYLRGTLIDEFTYTYYNDKNGTFEMLFQKYTASDVDNIYQPYTIE